MEFSRLTDQEHIDNEQLKVLLKYLGDNEGDLPYKATLTELYCIGITFAELKDAEDAGYVGFTKDKYVVITEEARVWLGEYETEQDV